MSTASQPHASRADASRWFDQALFVAGLVGLWQVGHWIIGGEALPSPIETLARLYSLSTDGDFSGHLSETGRSFLAALAISLFGGLGLGVLLGAHRYSGEVAEPMLVALYAIPKITLYPIILLIFGLGMSAKVAFGAIHGIIPVILLTMTAVRNVRPVQRRVAQSLGMGPWRTAVDILIPATIPQVVTGFRLGFALTLLGTLIGEMFASQRGIGHLLIRAMETNEPRTILALALFLTTFATLASALLLAIERRLHASR